MKVNLEVMMHLYAGGICFFAILKSKKLSPEQKLMMIVLGNEVDVRECIDRYRYCSHEKLMEYTSLSHNVIVKISASLEKKGYIGCRRQFDDNGNLLSASYVISEKIFDEYASFLEEGGK